MSWENSVRTPMINRDIFLSGLMKLAVEKLLWDRLVFCDRVSHGTTFVYCSGAEKGLSEEEIDPVLQNTEGTAINLVPATNLYNRFLRSLCKSWIP